MISVSQYRKKLEKTFGFASKVLMVEYAEARHKWKVERIKAGLDFDPFTDDPNCKTCRKKKKGEQNGKHI